MQIGQSDLTFTQALLKRLRVRIPSVVQINPAFEINKLKEKPYRRRKNFRIIVGN